MLLNAGAGVKKQCQKLPYTLGHHGVTGRCVLKTDKRDNVPGGPEAPIFTQQSRKYANQH